jgi:hypothetical protein
MGGGDSMTQGGSRVGLGSGSGDKDDDGDDNEMGDKGGVRCLMGGVGI